MIRKVRLLLLWIAIIPLGVDAQGIGDIISALRDASPYYATGRVTLVPAGSDREINYELSLRSSKNSASRDFKNLYCVDYRLLEGDSVEGFSVFDGKTLYRYDGMQLTEYSREKESLTTERLHSMQFAEFLPAYIADDIASAATDDLATVDVAANGPDRINLTIVRRADGAEQLKRVYTLDAATFMPYGIDSEANVGTPAEISYSVTLTPRKGEPITAELVDRLHGDILSRFSSENLAPENFAGYKMPLFTLPALRGGRYTFKPHDETLIVLIDDTEPDALEDTRQAVRDGIARHPRGAEIDILYVLLSRYADAVPASDSSSRHERILLDGNRLATVLGAKQFPVVMLVDDYGVVDAVATCRNNELSRVVIDVIGE